MDKIKIPTTRVRWASYSRIVSTRYPPIDLFDDIADPDDWWDLGVAESRTNPRISESLGKLDLIPRDRLVGGPGARWLMAPFTHISPDNKGRFNDGTFGVFYAARSFETALFETIYHRTNFYSKTKQEPGWIAQFRELQGSIDARLHDLRKGSFKPYLSKKSYVQSQKLAVKLKESGSNGIVYPSVRHVGGQCFASFYPDVMEPPKMGKLLSFHWDGERVNQIKEITGKRNVFRVEP